MSKLVDDVKSGLKGIRGAGDALRGEVLDATDKAFDTNPNHPETLKQQADNRTIAEKGKQDMKGADNMMARREWEHRGAEPPAHVGRREHDQPRTAELDRPNEGLEREPGTILPGETERYDTGKMKTTEMPQPGARML
ncbi:hypothetical protein F53441_1500 [Fusarium austroafricanum]|uniref:Uncharacterized protein n=1 Tax=Fusarium austroafricanum TaxID=2364996 RepID=A0A8H4KUE5_9HYPO|nr:hypothetical protein F53441_1500 [Fusarium austroafricanum]